MTRTELLSMAERLTMYGFGDDCQTDVADAAAILRKLAELRPVAQVDEDGSVDFVVWDQPQPMTLLYTLSEVLTDV